MDSLETRQLVDDIASLKTQRNAVLLSHNYQIPDVQDVADYVGDSLALSRVASRTAADVIVFCGVHFMAESASLLSPTKTVLLPAPDAGCPMADMVDDAGLVEMKRRYPGAAVVLYVNSSAAAKAEADICCTSSNAVRIVRSLTQRQVIFAPDKNLGHWVAQQVPEKELLLWEGFCVTHHRVSVSQLVEAREARPDAVVCVHPECQPELVAMADFVGSTAQIIAYCGDSPAREFIIGTEMGILHQLRKDSPTKEFYIMSPGLVCPNMKKTTLAHVKRALETLSPVISVDEPIRSRASQALLRMLAVE